MDALQDFRVIDLSTGIAGPIVGMFCADFGAEVVKIEPPAGDPARATAGFAVWNRGKKSVVVDPGDDARVRWLKDQIAGADVLITNGGAQLSQFQLDLDDLAMRHGRLVVAVMPPYLNGYTPWAGGHESAELLAAIGGQSWRQSSTSGDPIDSVYPTLLYAHGLWATVCTIAALVEREGSGAGQLVYVNGTNAVQHLLGASLMIDADSPDVGTGTGPGGRHPTYTRMIAADGKWLASGALGVKFETQLLAALGLTEMLAEPRMGGSVAGLVHPDNIDWAQKKIADAFLARPRDEWVEILDKLGIPVGPLLERQDWLDHPQVRAVDMRVEVEDPERGRVVMPGIPVKLEGTPGRVRGPAPMLGQHDRDIPAWPAQPDGASRPPIRPGPLTGYSILDTGTFVASPYAGSLLSELGADVVKVEPVTGDAFRVSGYTGNRGMRSLAINLQDPRGQEVFHNAVKQADAFIDGLRPGVTKKLNIDDGALRAIKPNIVTLSLSAYGEGGPLGAKGGVDYVIQGMSGMMTAEGGSGDPVINSVALCDMNSAAFSALGITLGLLHRARTGEGQRIWDGLLLTSAYLQAGEIVDYANRPPSRIGGPDFRGDSPYDRMYEVADGWIRIQAGPGVDGARAAATALGLDRPTLEADPTSAISDALCGRSGTDAVAALNAAGLAAVPVRKISEVIRDPRLRAAEFVHVTPSADEGHFLCGAGRYAVFSRSGRTGAKLVPGVGEHTADVLREAGYDARQTADLALSGVVVQGGPMEHRLTAPYR